MSKKTGRPKEEDGHKRINVSADEFTREIINYAENKSKFVEYAVQSYAHFRVVRGSESRVHVSKDHKVFKTGARFTYFPISKNDNALLSLCCCFVCRSTGEGFEFRLKINDSLTSVITCSCGSDWTASRVYRDSDFEGGVSVLPNQGSYVVEFQFKPTDPSCSVFIKDINVVLEIADGMPATLK